MYSAVKVQAYMPTTQQVFQSIISVDYLYSESMWSSSAVTTKVLKVEINNELQK